MSVQSSLEQTELELMLEGIFRVYGYDFREYAKSSLLRRVRGFMEKNRIPTLTQALDRILHDPTMMHDWLACVLICVTQMFRDPFFYKSFRLNVVPILKTYPMVRIWVAGCASGEEVYSLAILLKEEGIYDKCRIYATDLEDAILKKAHQGVFPLQAMKKYTQSYNKAGGTREFSQYYYAKHHHAIFKEELKEHIVFSRHNLISDASFNEFNVILCRNVMIYFEKELQDKVLKLLLNSLCKFGVLCLGSKESLHFTCLENKVKELESKSRIFQLK